MFKGFLAFGDLELANAERTEAYVRNLAPHLPLTPQGGLGMIHLANGEPAYRSPLLDDAPWSNRNDPITDQFYGLYPLDILGIGDSTYAATTTESVGAGGTTNGGRSATRDVRVTGLLVANSELAAETGLTWLRNGLQQSDCADQCGGGNLRYYLSEPALCVPLWGAEDGTSRFRRLGAFSGPSGVVDVRWTRNEVDPSMPSRVLWGGVIAEGTEVRHGARTLSGDVLAVDQGIPLRRNYAINGSFIAGTDNWTASPGSGYGTGGYGAVPYGGSDAAGTNVTWTYQGGTDGGGYARLNPPPDQTDPTNYSSGNYGDGVYGQTQQTMLTSAVWATPPGPVTVSLSLRGGPAVLDLIDGVSGAVVNSVPTGSAALSWTRYAITGVTNTTRLRIRIAESTDVDAVQAEPGTYAHDYFDGNGTEDDYTTIWTGTPNASISERRWNFPLETTWPDSDYLPFFEVLSGSVANLRLTWFYRDNLDIQDQLQPYERTLHNVEVTQGPVIIQRIDKTAAGLGYFIQVEMLFTAGNPFSYSPPAPVPTTSALSLAFTDPAPTAPLVDDWLFDPNALVPTPPPAAPDIVADAIDATITKWQRYYVNIPADRVADWASSVPIMQIDSLANPVRQVRVRFHPNPFSYPPQMVDPTSYCADFLISYLPPRTSLLMNGMVQKASATKSGVATVPAESILYGSDGGPMTWPHLSCGIPYVVTVDVPSPADYATFNLQLQLSREE